MTFLELCKKVRQSCGVQGSGPGSVVDQVGILKQIVDWTADADMDVQSAHPDWNFLWDSYSVTTTTALGFTSDTTLGSAALSVPDDLGIWDRESFGIARGTATGRSINLISYEEWRSNFSLKSNAEPYSLCIAPNGKLFLSAPANDSYSITADYWKTPTRLAANSDEPVYPARFQQIIVAKAKMYYFEYVESVTQWEQAKLDYEKYLNKLEGFALPGQQAATQSSPAAMVVRPA